MVLENKVSEGDETLILTLKEYLTAIKERSCTFKL